MLDTYPELKLVVLETGCHWFIPLYDRASDATKAMMDRAFQQGRFFMSCEPEEDLKYVIGRFGDDFLVIASDFPHLDDSRHDDPESEFRAVGLSDSTITKLMSANAERCYPLLSRVETPA